MAMGMIKKKRGMQIIEVISKLANAHPCCVRGLTQFVVRFLHARAWNCPFDSIPAKTTLSPLEMRLGTEVFSITCFEPSLNMDRWVVDTWLDVPLVCVDLSKDATCPLILSNLLMLLFPNRLLS